MCGGTGWHCPHSGGPYGTGVLTSVHNTETIFVHLCHDCFIIVEKGGEVMVSFTNKKSRFVTKYNDPYRPSVVQWIKENGIIKKEVKIEEEN